MKYTDSIHHILDKYNFPEMKIDNPVSTDTHTNRGSQ